MSYQSIKKNFISELLVLIKKIELESFYQLNDDIAKSRDKWLIILSQTTLYRKLNRRDISLLN